MINTAVGVTEPKETGPIITQGGVSASILSSTSIDKGTDDTFANSDSEVVFSGLPLAPLRYVDDILRMAESVQSAQHANLLMEDLFLKKSLSFNLKKSQFLIMGNKKARKEFRQNLEQNPLKLCGILMKETKTLKYLGDSLSFSLEESAHQTVMKRVGIVKQTILDIRTVIEDTRANKLGAINVAFNIWEQALCLMILQNSESWIGLTKKTLRVLDDLFQGFSQKIWRVCVGSPIPNYYWISGCLKSSNSILLRKLEFAHHLANLPPDSLGRIIFDLEESDIKGHSLKKDCADHIAAIGIESLRDVSKAVWKRKIKKYIYDKQRNELLEDMRSYKKLNVEELSKKNI